VLLLGSLPAIVPLAGCNSIGSDRENTQPTDPTPGTSIPQRGSLAITPGTVDLTVTGGTGGGRFFIFHVTGGEPPYVWSNNWTEMGLLIPIDEFGVGYFNAVKYVVRDFRGTGDDTIMVRDNAGAFVTALFTKTIEDAATPGATAPVVIPSTAAITCGGSIDLTASGGDGRFRWTTSNPATQLRDPSTNLPDNSGTTIRLDTSATAGCVAASTVTVTVTSAGQTVTAAITLNAP
jgi:hypothetical protein